MMTPSCLELGVRSHAMRDGDVMGQDTEPFRTLVVDCPWRFGDSLPGPKRGASSHYGCLDVAELKAFPLPPIADDAVCFFWRVAAMGEEGYAVLRAWGFVPKAELVWVKRTKHGKRHIGMGHYVRAEHEVCLIGTRGRPEMLSKSVRSTFEAPVGRHSEKPDAFYRIVERLAPAPRVELFGRRLRPGWTVLGNDPALSGVALPAEPMPVELPAQASFVF
jgi:N6-adenosine-specific RNA methylase IME4